MNIIYGWSPGATTYDNGDIHTGEYEDDLRHGEGVMVWSSAGRRYSGNYVLVSRGRIGSGNAAD